MIHRLFHVLCISSRDPPQVSEWEMKLSGREVRFFAAYIDARSRKLSFSSIAIFPPGSVPCLDLLNSVGF